MWEQPLTFAYCTPDCTRLKGVACFLNKAFQKQLLAHGGKEHCGKC